MAIYGHVGKRIASIVSRAVDPKAEHPVVTEIVLDDGTQLRLILRDVENLYDKVTLPDIQVIPPQPQPCDPRVALGLVSEET